MIDLTPNLLTAAVAITSAATCITGVAAARWHFTRKLEQQAKTTAELFQTQLEALLPACEQSAAAKKLAEALAIAVKQHGMLSQDTLRNQIQEAAEQERAAIQQPFIEQTGYLLEGLHGANEYLKVMTPDTPRDTMMKEEAMDALAEAFRKYKVVRDGGSCD